MKFNFVAKRLARRLSHLGGTPLIETGLADDQHDLGPDAVVDPWLEKFWMAISKIYNFSADEIKTQTVPSARSEC